MYRNLGSLGLLGCRSLRRLSVMYPAFGLLGYSGGYYSISRTVMYGATVSRIVTCKATDSRTATAIAELLRNQRFVVYQIPAARVLVQSKEPSDRGERHAAYVPID
jgi:hypothetical protein